MFDKEGAAHIDEQAVLEVVLQVPQTAIQDLGLNAAWNMELTIII